MTKACGPPAACHYCGLPLAAPAAGSAEPDYCCWGCRFAASLAGSGGEQGQVNWGLVRFGLAAFFTMNVFVFSMELWTTEVYATEAAAGVALWRDLFRYLALVFSVPVVLLLGFPVAESGWLSLRRGRLSTDVLLALGVGAAFLYSSVSTFRGSGQVYYEVGCVVLLAVTLGRWLEAGNKLRTAEALTGLSELLPERVRLVLAGETQWRPLAELQAGNLVRVLPGERVPADATLERGSALCDERLLTGESEPRLVQPGDRLFGGALNLDGDLCLRVQAAPRAGALARLEQTVREAATSRGRYQILADRLAAGFVPLVAVVSLAALAWHAHWHGWERGLLAALSVLVVACPCALGLATPLTMWIALCESARRGVVFRQGAALERLASVKVVCLDKTGTLTTGEPTVEQMRTRLGEEQQVQRVAASLCRASTHALSTALERFLEPALELELAEQIVVAPGRGVGGRPPGFAGDAWLGSPRLMDERGLELDSSLATALSAAEQAGRSVVCVGWEKAVRGVFVVREELRPAADEATAALAALGLQVVVLTGDHRRRGAALGKRLGVHVEAGLLPEDKLRFVAELRRSHGPVLMVGDGVNDAPALAAAEVGLALGCGADLARHAAEVCLLGDDLTQVAWSVSWARQTVRVLRQNLAWTFGYNALGIATAASGWLNPIVAAVLMLGSSLIVVNSAWRLKASLRPPSEDRATDQPVVLPSEDLQPAAAREQEAACV
ncbi:MAG: cation-translocating P-type ATPase [Pirellulales bacterium]